MAHNLSDSDTDSEFLGFTQSALYAQEHNVSETSDVELTASSSSDDESENDDNDDGIDDNTDENDHGNGDNTDEFGDYCDGLIDEVIGKQLDRNPPNWSAENFQISLFMISLATLMSQNSWIIFQLTVQDHSNFFVCILQMKC